MIFSKIPLFILLAGVNFSAVAAGAPPLLYYLSMASIVFNFSAIACFISGVLTPEHLYKFFFCGWGLTIVGLTLYFLSRS